MRIRLEDEFGEAIMSMPFDVTIEDLNRAALTETACLRFLDPFGHTVFNHRQARVLLLEISTFAFETNGEVVAEAARLLQRCADGTHLYVRFIGS